MFIKRFLVKQTKKAIIAILPDDRPIVGSKNIYIKVTPTVFAMIKGDYRNDSPEKIDELYKKTIENYKQ